MHYSLTLPVYRGPRNTRSWLPVRSVVLASALVIPFVAVQGLGAQVLPSVHCLPLMPARKALPQGHISVVTSLPKSLDPSGCPMRMQRGTMVFKIYTQRVRYTAASSNGASVASEVELDGLIRSYSRTRSALIIRMNDGRVLTYPPNARISPPNPNDFDLTFIAPGASVPPDVRALAIGRPIGSLLKPDYVVP